MKYHVRYYDKQGAEQSLKVEANSEQEVVAWLVANQGVTTEDIIYVTEVISRGSLQFEKARVAVSDSDPILWQSRPSKIAFVLRAAAAFLIQMLVLLVFMRPLIFPGFYYVSSLLSVFVFVVLLTVGNGLYFYFQWKNSYYVVTETKIVIGWGVFNWGMTIIFRHSVESVTLNHGFIDRLLSLSTVKIWTGGFLSMMRGAMFASTKISYV